MEIYVEDQILKFENNTEEIDRALEEIDMIINSTEKVLSHMVIDDLEIYSDYYEYLLSNIRVIKEIKVISNTYEELVNDILQSTWEYADRVPIKIEEVANDFYKSPESQNWEDLNDLLGGISWIISTFSTIDEDTRLKDVVSSYESWNIYAKGVNSLGEILLDFEEALSNSDNVSIADILIYEILPILNEISESLPRLFNMEELANGLN